jgi:hypothetical protein
MPTVVTLCLGLRPRLHQPIGQPAAGLHEECARAHGRVADLQVEQFGG